MKNNYSHPVLLFKKLKKSGKNITETFSQLVENISKGIPALDFELNLIWKHQYLWLADTELGILHGLCTHVFIEEEGLFNFLMNTEVKIQDDFDLIFLMNPFYQYDLNKRVYVSTITINHKTDLNSIVFSSAFKESQNRVYFLISLGDRDGDVFMTYDYADIKLKNWVIIDKFKPYINLYLNLIYYANAFPEKILNGVPRDFYNQGSHSGNKFVRIEPHEKIIDRSGPIPHYRKGHFRRLDNEYFKNKKGQIIWINSCFIKGYEAKTII